MYKYTNALEIAVFVHSRPIIIHTYTRAHIVVFSLVSLCIYYTDIYIHTVSRTSKADPFGYSQYVFPMRSLSPSCNGYYNFVLQCTLPMFTTYTRIHTHGRSLLYGSTELMLIALYGSRNITATAAAAASAAVAVGLNFQ